MDDDPFNDFLSLVYAVVDQPSAGATPGPLRPMNLAALPGDAQVTLSWSPVSGVTYTLSRALSAAGPFQPVATGLTATAYTDTGLTDGTTYYYVVTAADAFGTSAASNVASATPRAVPGFALSPAASGLTLAQGASGTTALAVTPLNGFSGGVSLYVGSSSGILDGPDDPYSIAATLAPGDVTLDGTDVAPATLSLGVGAQVPPGVYPLQVTGYDDATGTLTHAATVSVTVTPAATGVHLADLELGPTAVTGGDPDRGTAAVTLTLSAPAPADVTVALRSNSPAVLMPASVVIPQGQSSVIFNVAASTVSEAAQVTLSGSCGGWTQAARLTALPVDYPLTIQGLCAAPGNGSVVVFW